MARKESSQPIFEPVGAGVGRALRPVNKLVRDWLLESQTAEVPDCRSAQKRGSLVASYR